MVINRCECALLDGDVGVSMPLLDWFVDQIELFAPPEWADERQQLYAELSALQPVQDTALYENIVLYVLAQVMAAHRLTQPATAEKPLRRDRSAHESWYGKERQRVAKLIEQIGESPIVATFHARVRYYSAENVTCPHGRNQKTCDALYALQVTFGLLERYPALSLVRKQADQLRRLEPHLPPLSDLCLPQPSFSTDGYGDVPVLLSHEVISGSRVDECILYLLGTVVGRLREVGLTVAQSCRIVDQLLLWCFDLPDIHTARSEQLAKQWRRLY